MSTRAALCVPINSKQILVSRVMYEGNPLYAGSNLINFFSEKEQVEKWVLYTMSVKAFRTFKAF